MTLTGWSEGKPHPKALLGTPQHVRFKGIEAYPRIGANKFPRKPQGMLLDAQEKIQTQGRKGPPCIPTSQWGVQQTSELVVPRGSQNQPSSFPLPTWDWGK